MGNGDYIVTITKSEVIENPGDKRSRMSINVRNALSTYTAHCQYLGSLKT